MNTILEKVKTYATDIGSTNPKDVVYINRFLDMTKSISHKLVQDYLRSIPTMEKPEAVKQFYMMFSDIAPDFHLNLEGIYSDAEWKILLLKEMQEGQFEEQYGNMSTGRTQKIAETFSTTEQTINAKRRILEDTDLFGSSIKINVPHGHASYDNTIHPVVLALNLAEANFLTTVLRERFKGDPLERMAADIAFDVYSQLTAYGKKFINKNAEKRGIDFSDLVLENPSSGDTLHYKPNKGYRHDTDHIFGLIEKKRQYCNLSIDSDSYFPTPAWIERDYRQKTADDTPGIRYVLTDDAGNLLDIPINEKGFTAWDIKDITLAIQNRNKN